MKTSTFGCFTPFPGQVMTDGVHPCRPSWYEKNYYFFCLTNNYCIYEKIFSMPYPGQVLLWGNEFPRVELENVNTYFGIPYYPHGPQRNAPH